MVPKGDRVIVRKLHIEDEVVTPSGLVLTEAALEQLGQQPIGVVVGVGPDVTVYCAHGCPVRECENREYCLERGGDAAGVWVGEIVLYQRHGGTEITIEGVQLLVFRESEILAGLDEIEAGSGAVDLKAHLG